MTITLPETERTPASIFRMRRSAFDELVASGFFNDHPNVELLDGILFDMPVQGPRHARARLKTETALRSHLKPDQLIISQSPIALDDESEPEPDVAIVSATILEGPAAHPKTAALIVEVSDTTLTKDREVKLPLYARNGIPECWIINLVDNLIEVYREPEGTTYLEKRTFKPGGRLSPLATPDAAIAVDDLLG